MRRFLISLPFQKKACMRTFSVFFFIIIAFCSNAQQNIHHQSSQYEWPKDPLVQQKLDHWQDQKFGIIIHWGLYAVPGIIESWSLCSEEWITRDTTSYYGDYKKWYWGLQKDFNPVNFNPGEWAKTAKAAGMKYLVFTTKHHDGFCMFDTKQTDFKITNGPFALNPKANVAKHVFDAFRKEGMMIGAYFSKPDWHSENYWWPVYATPDRNNNYDIRKFPWRWEKFKKYTFHQIEELMNDYGKMDILWLDGGWVRPLETVNDEVRSWGARIPDWSQDIDMPAIAAMARKAQPGLLIVDRTVHGPYENYQTPEQRVPDKKIKTPWESCMTLCNNWGFVPNDPPKPASRVIRTLIEVVAKGGSLLLGIGPKPDGTFPSEVVQKLNEIGVWTSVNGDAIYNTRPSEIYNDGNVFFTQSKNGFKKFALSVFDEAHPAGQTIEWEGNFPKSNSKITLLQTGKTVKWKRVGNKVIVQLPKNVKPLYNALAFSFNS